MPKAKKAMIGASIVITVGLLTIISMSIRFGSVRGTMMSDVKLGVEASERSHKNENEIGILKAHVGRIPKIEAKLDKLIERL